jgi:hypothetical protein
MNIMANKDLSLSVKVEKQKSNFIFSRWFFLFLILTIYFIQDLRGYDTLFINILIASILYNLSMSIYIFVSTKKNRDIKNFFSYFDIFFVCAFIYMSGGIRSDIFFMFFFILAFNGIKTKNNSDNYLGIFTVFLYSLFYTN